MNKKPAEMTPWFPAGVKPAHRGVYPASKLRTPGVLRYWNGHCWSRAFNRDMDRESIIHAMRTDAPAGLQLWIEWRGFTEPQKIDRRLKANRRTK